jgi:hypothetical protein
VNRSLLTEDITAYYRRMKTILTLDDDVAAELERLCRVRDADLTEIVNEAPRRGLRNMTKPPHSRERFSTPTVDLGRALIPHDNVSEAIAVAEGEHTH